MLKLCASREASILQANTTFSSKMAKISLKKTKTGLFAENTANAPPPLFHRNPVFAENTVYARIEVRYKSVRYIFVKFSYLCATFKNKRVQMKVISGLIIGGSGSIGGITFSRNKAGFYVKTKPIPTNPKTNGQQNARARFGIASQLFKTLTQSERAGWSTFAQNLFVPLRKINTGQYSGASAFASVRNVNSSETPLFNNAIIAKNSPPSTLTTTVQPVVAVTTAPTQGLVATQLTNTSEVATISVGLVSLGANGNNVVILDYNAGKGVDFFNDQLVDGNGNEYGITGYLSSVVNAVGFRPKDEFRYPMGFSGINSFTIGDLANVETLRFNGTVPNVASDYLNYPKSGEIVKASIFMYSMDGQQIKLGESWVTIS